MAIHADQRGQMAIAVLIVTLGVFILAALAIDAGVWFMDHRSVQNRAEAAATAAILDLPDDPAAARDRAEDWLRFNGEDALADALVVAANCQGMAAGEARIVFGDGNSTAEVCLRRDSAVLLSALTAITEVRVSASAVAQVHQIPLPYALMAMNPSDCRSLDVSGNGNVQVLGDGATYTASSCSSRALNVSGNGVLDAGFHDVCGGARATGGGVLNGEVNEGVCGIPDPWADLVPPAAGACAAPPDFDDPSQNGTPANSLAPGVYCSLDVSHQDVQVELTGGVYVFKGAMQFSGQNTRLFSSGETLLYFTCSSSPCNGSAPGGLKFTGGASGVVKLELTGHSGYEHIAIWVDRTAAAGSKCVSITGQGNVDIDGNIYAAGCTVDMAGQGDAQFDLNGTIIGDNIDFSGQAQYNVTWDVETAPTRTVYALIR